MQNDVHTSDAGLTVSAVAELLGIPAPTLRSWDRRYGVGATGHEVGRARLYSSADVERLRRMKRLIDSGVPAGTAAVRAGEASVDALPPVSVEEFIEIGRRDYTELRKTLTREVNREGLITTWKRLIEPAIHSTERDVRGRRPGRSLITNLFAALMQVEDELTRSIVVPPGAARITVFFWEEHLILGGLVASAIYAEGMDVRAIAIANRVKEDAFTLLCSHLDLFDPQVVVVLGHLPGDSAQMTALLDRTNASFLLISTDFPTFVHPRLQRVRTVVSGVQEALEMGLERSPAHSGRQILQNGGDES